jgi:hypothetical protein
VPCIMLNPQLINMDQGFGVRKSPMSPMSTVYCLLSPVSPTHALLPALN